MNDFINCVKKLENVCLFVNILDQKFFKLKKYMKMTGIF